MKKNDLTLVLIGHLMSFSCIAVTVDSAQPFTAKESAVRSPNVSRNDYEVWVEENKPATLFCAVEGKSLKNFKWLRKVDATLTWKEVNISNALKINETYAAVTFDVANVTSEDNGTLYKCSAEDDGRNVENTLHIKTFKEQESYQNIQAVGPDRIYLRIDRMNFITQYQYELFLPSESNIHYKEIGTREWQHAMSLTNDDIPSYHVITGLKNDTAYMIRNVITPESQNLGTVVQYKWVTTLKQALEYLPIITIVNVSSSTITIKWKAPPPELEGYISFYNVSIRKYQNETPSEVKVCSTSQSKELSYVFNITQKGRNYFEVTACSVDSCEDRFRSTLNLVVITLVVNPKYLKNNYQLWVEENTPVTLLCDLALFPLKNFKWLKKSPGSLIWNEVNVSSSSLIKENVDRTLDIANVTSQDNGTLFKWSGEVNEQHVQRTMLIVTYGEKESYKNFRAVGSDRIYLRLDRVDFIIADPTLVCWSCSYVIDYKENGTNQWQYAVNQSFFDVRGYYVMNGLKPDTAYQIRNKIIDPVENSTTVFQYKWTRTLKQDIEYVPSVSILKVTSYTVTIEWTAPSTELEGYISLYNASIRMSGHNGKHYMSQTKELRYTFNGLTPTLDYDLHVSACSIDACRHVYASVTLKQVRIESEDSINPDFVPIVFVNASTNYSIPISWTEPQDSYVGPNIHYYHLLLSTSYGTNRSIYVNGTTNSLTIGNLLQYAEYQFYVAACGRYRMNCGPWSDPVKAVIPGALDTQNIGCLSQMRVWRIVLALILLIVTGTLVVRKLRKKALKRKLIRARLSNFNDGNEMILNPNVAVNDQAELLHYENKYEFPRNLLKLGDILESGTFNVVRKGQAKTIRSHEAVTTVAVKTVRATASLDCKTALLRELRILCYIGNHLNLVNLLGACTKNLQYSQICVIVEFCRFGNIRDYLLRHRRDFVNQLGYDTGEIRDRNLLVDTIDANDRGSENKSQCNDNEDAEGCSDNNDPKCTSVGADVVTEAQIAEPKLPFKYPGDDTETVTDPICTQDLVCWAWQISRGMQYLGAKKVLHGDLAARNILLSDNNVVKICDFGLSKSLREEQNFANNERGPLPVKWMAIESLRDRVFSTKSDVWSYGIVLWELFSLADTPYHGIRPENMYQTLIEGYRMERPKYAPQILYDMMLHCWKEEPSERPSFESLIWKISEMVDEHVKLYYLDLGNSYTEMYADDWRRERETVIKGEESVSHDETQL
ncbi:uncharacterized protein LOC124305012 isoform X1 [Neodiprion virginianus]|uniref:uncharacterized protein LOC124305012 isoform X1 n=1 Tax=Neodiprion virginianus TaxID=2961670 RepID=UPI001EE776ED|nr:uncharacterized protein LOC124305012 isoform X1 [Neodiprion virginianus]